jgi:Ethanolamine utilization protein EutJ (predicted chaperonin)
VERLRLEARAEPRGDLLGRGVRLLGCEPALLDREVRPVACRVQVLRVVDAGVVVDRDEAVLIGR